MIFRRLQLGVFVAVSVLAIACGDPGSDQSGADARSPGTVLRRGNGGDPQTLDPARADDVHALNVLTDLYEGLYAVDRRGDVVSAVARETRLSEDALTWTFSLDPAASWSDGTPVEAGQFVTALRRVVDPVTASPYAELLSGIRNAAAIVSGETPATLLGVRAPDAGTLVIELERPVPELPALLAMPMAAPSRFSADIDAATFSDPAQFVGNGPFVLEHWRVGDSIRLRRNAGFRQADDVRLAAVEYYPTTDPAAEARRYRSGELHVTATIPRAQLDLLLEERPGEVVIAPSLGVYYLAFDLTEAPLDSLALRRALSMSIDRETIAALMGRGERPAYGFIPDGIPGYVPARYDWKASPAGERLAQARDSYRRAGYTPDAPLTIKLTYDAGDVHETVAAAVASMWRETLGIDVVLDKREWKYFLDSRDRRSEWQVMRFAWIGDYGHPATFARILRSTSEQNLPRYSSRTYDRLLSLAETAESEAASMAAYAAAEREMLSDFPVAPLYFYVSKHLVSPAVAGFEPNALDRHPSRYLSLTRP